jgi:p-cumate 2,3-dioxygenase beta subunit
VIPVGALYDTVRDFLFYDAELLDGWQLKEWLDLFTADCRYLVPATDRPGGDPNEDLFLIQDDHFLLSERVDGLIKGTAWAESPRSTTHRMIANVRVRDSDEGTVQAQANFLVHRINRGRVDVFPGHLEVGLVPGGSAGFEIRLRRAVLALDALRPQGRLSILL